MRFHIHVHHPQSPQTRSLILKPMSPYTLRMQSASLYCPMPILLGDVPRRYTRVVSASNPAFIGMVAAITLPLLPPLGPCLIVVPAAPSRWVHLVALGSCMHVSRAKWRIHGCSDRHRTSCIPYSRSGRSRAHVQLVWEVDISFVDCCNLRSDLRSFHLSVRRIYKHRLLLWGISFIFSRIIDLSLFASSSQGRRHYVTDSRISSICFRFHSCGIFPIPCYLGSLLTRCFILTVYCSWTSFYCLSSIILTRFTSMLDPTFQVYYGLFSQLGAMSPTAEIVACFCFCSLLCCTLVISIILFYYVQIYGMLLIHLI